ncbi:MAG: chemotaxis response regulator protein-glutamate methylesterase [Nitrospinae bacterium]|nr:chemotaxis response regulator protein-glutamate methylesterase [Nitrospinota bacterium]
MIKSKVLIVDDSAIVRKKFSDGLKQFSDIEIVGTAVDAYDARDKIINLKPDVVTLDIMMPRMDGLTFLGKLMKHFPLPVIMVSGATMEGGDITLKCLEEGAFDFVAKPSALSGSDVDSLFKELHEKILCAKSSWKKKKNLITHKTTSKTPEGGVKSILSNDVELNKVLIAIASSTGGTDALTKIFTRLPDKMPPIIVTQHMPPNFTALFAKRLNGCSSLTIKEAEEGEILKNSHVYIAPGGSHLKIKESGSSLRVVLGDEEKVHHQRPAADVMFNSILSSSKKILGVVLTGMGADGARGLLELKEKGSYNISQDENSCVVYGMPKEAVKLNAIDEVLPLSSIPEKLVSLSAKLAKR